MRPAGVPAEKLLTCGYIEDRKNGIENTMRLTMSSGAVIGTSGGCIKKASAEHRDGGAGCSALAARGERNI